MTYQCIGIPLLAFLLYFNCAAQPPAVKASLKKADSAKTVFYLPAGKRTADVQWRDSIYRFPFFENGQIMFATGYTQNSLIRMNYNLYHMQMDYISAGGDTLQVKPSSEFKLITIASHLFLYDSKVGYIEVVQQSAVALGMRPMMIARYIDYPSGGYSRNAGSTPFRDTDQRGAAMPIDRYYVKGGDYFFIDKDSKVYKASSSSAFKLFREHRKVVKEYLDAHNVDFENREDLMKLLSFCNGLNQKT